MFPGVLVTREFLVKEQVKNMGGLRTELPDLNLAEVASAPWLESVRF